MCRSDDGDYEWYVDATFREAVAEGESIRCEDCGREVKPGEMIVRYTCTPGSEYDDERPYVTIVFRALEGRRYYIPGQRWIAIYDGEAGDTLLDYYESIGLAWDEERDPRIEEPPLPDHFSCVQCKAAERWLEEICSQHVVLVTVTDLVEHLGDYDEATLGADFVTMTTLGRHQWADHDGRPVSEDFVKSLADGAIKHAVAVGMHPD